MDVEKRFSGKVAIVTGAGSGIGLATAKRLGAEGASIIIADLHPNDAAKYAVQQAGAPDVWATECDVSQEAQVEATVAETMQRHGRLDVIVNNAGLMIFKSIEDHRSADWLRILSVDLLGAFYFIRQAFHVMKPGGAIVNVSSVHAVETTPLVASYAAAKAALLSLTRSAAIEGQSKGIRVNAILPGAVDTPMLWNNPNVKSGQETINPADVGKPEDIAATISYLASGDAQFVQGASLYVDGGRLSRL
jgi:NAD(P)-dependent dehydrogenase (short-subunit alcohol dehydrogenase family)